MRHRQDMYCDLPHALRKWQSQSLGLKGFSLTTALNSAGRCYCVGERQAKYSILELLDTLIFSNSIPDDYIIFTMVEWVLG